MIEEKLQTAEGCPRAPFQEARAGLPPRRSRPASGGGRGLRNSLRFCPPFTSFPPGSGLSVIFLKNKKIKAVAEKSKAHFFFPSAALCYLGPRREDVAGGLASIGALQSPHHPASPSRRGLDSVCYLLRGQCWELSEVWDHGFLGGGWEAGSRGAQLYQARGYRCLGTQRTPWICPEKRVLSS